MADGIVGKISVGDGATFIPSVSSSGILSWTNNKNLPNPAEVNIAQAVINSGAGLFLPLSGGLMNGSVSYSLPDFRLYANSNAQAIGILGGATFVDGASLRLFGKDHDSSSDAGSFYLTACDANGGRKYLVGKPDGTFTWDNNAIAMSKDVLPLSGGMMTGAITTTVSDFVKRSNDTAYLRVMGGTALANGASITLIGKDHNTQPGQFMLRARDASTYKDLLGKPDGTLLWGGNAIAMSKDVLPLSGGAMTGNVRWNMPNAETRLSRTDESGKMALFGGVNWSTSANLYLNGNASNAPGQFALTACDGTNSNALTGKPDGTLTWGGKAVIVGTEVSETFYNVTVPANNSVKVGELASAARYWSCFVTGAGLASVHVTMSADKKSVYAYNVTPTDRTLSFTVNYIV